MAKRLRWGILGTGNIARQFAMGLRAGRRGELTAVGSRSIASAQTFAAAHDIAAAVGSYEELISRDDIDAVYVSLPNSLHHRWTIAALQAGKHVLCEKPFSVTHAEAVEMFDAADRAGRVVMEAFMYLCHPQTIAIHDAARSGVIGQIKQVRTSFCYRTTKIAGNIRFDAALAGGALMDVGCYCLSFSRMLMGEPIDGSATGSLHPSGVDDLCSGWLRFDGSAVASFTCGTGLQANNTAYICGSEGYIEVPIPWKPPTVGGQFVIAHSTPPKQDFGGVGVPTAPPRRIVDIPAAGDPYAVEADDFAATILDGAPTRVSRDHTFGNMLWLERFRKQMGVGT